MKEKSFDSRKTIKLVRRHMFILKLGRAKVLAFTVLLTGLTRVLISYGDAFNHPFLFVERELVECFLGAILPGIFQGLVVWEAAQHSSNATDDAKAKYELNIPPKSVS
ncbi:MAG: hypothetical protein EOP04_12330 [Proteobacteria bacterium]|nr:MAG: hypothetical protein EOP04_12330 [Pseudomonadota bacterium]